VKARQGSNTPRATAPRTTTTTTRIFFTSPSLDPPRSPRGRSDLSNR
jgi:hypothetical protein